MTRLIVLLTVLAPSVAFAQEYLEPKTGPGTGMIVALVVSALLGVFGVAYGVVQKMAAREAVDGWDTAKEWMDKAKPVIEIAAQWADPKSKAVPPTPSNPAGEAE